MNETSMSEQILMTTVRIECTYSNGTEGTGTGFFLTLFTEENGDRFPILITNKHVIQNSVRGRLILPFKMGSHGPDLKGRYLLEIEEFETAWILHPDKQVDLCAMPFAIPYNMMIQEKKEPFIKFIDRSFIPTQEELSQFTAIEDVIMIGYPIGLWDAHNNLPIIRRGITATPPAIDHNGRSEFMIDAACFPGSSGSPVLLYNHGIYTSGGVAKLGDRIKSLGILYAGPIYDVNGKIEVIQIPTANVVYSKTGIPINLGYVIKSSRILDFEPIFREQLANKKLNQITNLKEIKSEAN